jgi:hypothetical protein
VLLFVAKFHTAVTKSSAKGTKDLFGGKKKNESQSLHILREKKSLKSPYLLELTNTKQGF